METFFKYVPYSSLKTIFSPHSTHSRQSIQKQTRSNSVNPSITRYSILQKNLKSMVLSINISFFQKKKQLTVTCVARKIMCLSAYRIHSTSVCFSLNSAVQMFSKFAHRYRLTWWFPVMNRNWPGGKLMWPILILHYLSTAPCSRDSTLHSSWLELPKCPIPQTSRTHSSLSQRSPDYFLVPGPCASNRPAK